MAVPNRRTFIAMTAGAAAGATVAGTVGTGTAPAATPGVTGTIADVKHVVILMQENRSFDHYFGTLQGVRGFADRATIQLAGGYSVFNQPNGGGRQYPWAFSAGSSELVSQCNGDLSHAWSDQHAAWNGGRMDAWVAAKRTNRTLGYLQRKDIPFHYALADNWTICDAYHCSALSATGP
ncbi:phospholipase C, phosphocholine-specific, partial [Streptomyces tateyamensis]